MRYIITIWIIFSLFCSCKLIKTETEKASTGCDCEKAKAILWIDKEKVEGLSQYPLRTVKVYANVYSDGTFRIISFCKKQTPIAESYIRKRAAVFVIRKELFEDGYLQPGKQYLQLRYVPD